MSLVERSGLNSRQVYTKQYTTWDAKRHASLMGNPLREHKGPPYQELSPNTMSMRQPLNLPKRLKLEVGALH